MCLSLSVFVGIVWWQCLYRVLLGSSKAGLGSCLMDHLLISLQKVRGVVCFVFKWFGVCYSVFFFYGLFMLMAKYCQSAVGLGWLRRQGLRSLHRWQILMCPLQLFYSVLWKLMEIFSKLLSLQEAQK